MLFTQEAKRVKDGQSLTDMYAQAQGAIAQLEGIKTNIANLKAKMVADKDYTTEDTAEVDVKIEKLVAAIKEVTA